MEKANVIILGKGHLETFQEFPIIVPAVMSFHVLLYVQKEVPGKMAESGLPDRPAQCRQEETLLRFGKRDQEVIPVLSDLSQ